MQEDYPFVWPIIHISCHGNDNGIGLTDRSYLKWDVLYNMLSIVNICFEEANPSSPILLSMSSCYGLHAIKADCDDALVAFSVFYHKFVNKKEKSDIALECTNKSINSPGYFKLFNSKDIYNNFKDYDDK